MYVSVFGVGVWLAIWVQGCNVLHCRFVVEKNMVETLGLWVSPSLQGWGQLTHCMMITLCYFLLFVMEFLTETT